MMIAFGDGGMRRIAIKFRDYQHAKFVAKGDAKF